MRKLRVTVLMALIGTAWPVVATEPTEATRRWWSHVRVLAADDMEGRDTGSSGFRKAAAYVVSQLKRAGLAPAGEGGGYYQRVPLEALRFRADRSSVFLTRPDGTRRPLRWLHQIGLIPIKGMPRTLDTPLAFSGWEIPADMEVRGKTLVALAPPRFVPGPRGYAQRPRPGYAATLVVQSDAGPEPVRWPAFSSTFMALAGRPFPEVPPGSAMGMSFNPADAEELFHGSAYTYKAIRALADAGERLPSFPMAVTLHARMAFEQFTVNSDNIVAVLRGADPALADEYVVVSAHLDGYGVGEPVNGDRIYNGALDDAAYVATMIELADRLRESDRRPGRSVLFTIFTAEERGLLGSQYFMQHPTVPKERMVANINLDMLRPIYPLTSLMTIALDDSTLGDTARTVAASLGIRVKADDEPDRMLTRRSDLWNFLQAGVPGLAFGFGYEKGSPEEAIYRRWYGERYHSPADDIDQRWNPAAAALFNDFLVRLVATVADDAQRPAWKPGSTFRRDAK